MKIVAKIYFYLYRKAIEREEPESPKRKVAKEILINLLRFIIRYFKNHNL